MVADDFWMHVYHNLIAENLAEGKTGCSLNSASVRETLVDMQFDDLICKPCGSAGHDADGEAIVDFDRFFEGSMGPSASTAALQPSVQQKHLPPMDWEELNMLFDHWVDVSDPPLMDPCSFATVKRAYHTSWAKALPFRKDSQHAKCTECIEFKQWRKRLPPGSKEIPSPLFVVGPSCFVWALWSDDPH
jgi:hypothetical protein